MRFCTNGTSDLACLLPSIEIWFRQLLLSSSKCIFLIHFRFNKYIILNGENLNFTVASVGIIVTRIKSPLEGGWNQSDDIQASRQPPHVTGIEKGLKRKFLSITNNFSKLCMRKNPSADVVQLWWFVDSDWLVLTTAVDHTCARMHVYYMLKY